ncbi:RHS repeat domain-containing protein [Pontibacter pudoricolor]|uniref:hypothetical protein n=1 Tax=Pontibacter pudoricolor TaxID=2694930 RepID=UPI0013918790|nr:hypothetical protein [Pontibacter pudoricolor]
MKTNIIKKLLLASFTVLFIAPSSLQAQQTPSEGEKATSLPVTKVIPKSPEAAALGKYGEIPVGLYTGVPNIAIPIHEIQLKDLSIPVSLNYHASGVRVDELASNVGLGWSLSAGGVVSAMTNGLNDFAPAGWVNTTQKTPQDRPISKTFSLSSASPYYQDPDYLLNDAATKNYSDTQPDLFSFSAPGLSGKFFYDQQGNCRIMPYQDIDVSYHKPSADASFPEYFIITDGKGNRFKYAEREQVTTTSVNSCASSAPSSGEALITSASFYLSQINTAKGETVTFSYESAPNQFQNQISQTRYTRLSDTGGCPLYLPACTESSTSSSDGIRIKQIYASTGERVVFHYETDRLDLPGTKQLDRVEVTHTGSPGRVKQFLLAYDYYRSGPAGSTNPLDNRLRLLSVEEVGKPAYAFTYEPTPLPPRLSMRQDHWGYFNGSSNSTLLRKAPAAGFPEGADREPNPAAMKAGVLTRIDYPTDGYTVFAYKPNDHYVEKYVLRVGDGRISATGTMDQYEQVTSFTVPVHALNMRATWDTGTDGINVLGYSTIRVTGPNGYSRNFTGRSLSEVPVSGMVPGATYNITVTRPDESDSTFMGIINFTWDRNEFFQGNVYAGGLRVSSMSDYPLAGDPLVWHYEYTSASDPTRSSGEVMFQPTYEYLHYTENQSSDGAFYECTYNAQVSSSMMPLSSVEGGNVAYRSVITYVGDKRNGYTLNEFFTGGATSGFVSFPFPPKVTNHWLNGLPIRTTHYRYDSTLDTYLPVRAESREYKTAIDTSLLNEYRVRGAKIAVLKPERISMLGEPQLSQQRATEFAIEYYYLSASWPHLDKVVTTEFDQAGIASIATETRYFYDNSTHGLVTRTETNDSKGSLIEQEYKYVLDMNQTEGSVYAEMAARRRHHYLVEEELSVEGVMQTKQLTSYAKFGTDTYEPASISMEAGSGPLVVQAIFHDYDAKSNLLQVSKPRGPRVSYRWDQRGTRPVAECVNALKTEFFYESFEDSATGTEGGARTGWRHSGGAYTVTWAPPNSRDYVISYWYRSGGVWHFQEEAPYTQNSLTLTGGMPMTRCASTQRMRT